MGPSRDVSSKQIVFNYFRLQREPFFLGLLFLGLFFYAIFFLRNFYVDFRPKIWIYPR